MKDKLKKSWPVIEDKLGQLTLLIILIVCLPALMVIGGVLLATRFYHYTSAMIHNKVPKRYYY